MKRIEKCFYPVLINRFKPIAHDEGFMLVDYGVNKEYFLTKDQYKLILQLDGTKTFDKILQKYSSHSRSIVMSFVQELGSLEAIKFQTNPSKGNFQKKIIKPYLESVLIDITSNCNLKCAHCYVSDYYREKKKDDLNLDQIFKLVDDLSLINVRDVTLTGGEPLLRKDIRKIISYIIQKNIMIRGFFTNGTLVTKDFVDYLSGLPYYTGVFISLDGITEKIHSVIRGKGVFYKTLKAVKTFINANIPVSINTAVNRYNLSQLENMYEFLKSLGVNQWRLAIPKPIGKYAINRMHLEPEWKKVAKVYYKIIDKHLSEIEIINGEIKAPINLEIEFLFHTQIVNTPVNFFKADGFACRYDKSRCAIKANGDVIPCGFLDDFIIGNVKHNNIIDLWLSSKMQKIKNIRVDAITPCQQCKYLKYCGTGCRANAFKISQNFFSKDIYTCPLVSFFEESIISLLKQHSFLFRVNDTKENFILKT